MACDVARNGKHEMSIGLFEGMALRSVRAGRMSRRDMVTLFRGIRAHRSAWRSGAELPEAPRRVARSFGLSAFYATWRFSIEQPLLFLVGGVCVLPAMPLLFWTMGRWVMRAIHFAPGAA